MTEREAEVRFGFASYKGGKFELIAINIKTGEGITLEGQLRPDQTLEQIDKVLPTCVYVTGTPAQSAPKPDLQRIFDRISARLNDCLCEMKPNYDDSIVGFNEAWDIVRAVFKDELK